MTLQVGERVYLPFDIPATELSAGTSIELVAPTDGYVEELITVVQTAIVTGGPITASIGVTAVTGLSITVANSATKGTTQSATPTAGSSTRAVAKNGRIQITPDAAFNGGGAVSGVLILRTNDNSPVQPF
jgi:hypothetical protein